MEPALAQAESELPRLALAPALEPAASEQLKLGPAHALASAVPELPMSAPAPESEVVCEQSEPEPERAVELAGAKQFQDPAPGFEAGLSFGPKPVAVGGAWLEVQTRDRLSPAEWFGPSVHLCSRLRRLKTWLTRS